MLDAERRNVRSGPVCVCVLNLRLVRDFFIFTRIFIGRGGGVMDFNFYSNFIPIYLYRQHKRTPLSVRFDRTLILSLCSLRNVSLTRLARTYHFTSACRTQSIRNGKNDIIDLTNYRRSILYNNLISQLILLDRSNAPRFLRFASSAFSAFLLFLFRNVSTD